MEYLIIGGLFAVVALPFVVLFWLVPKWKQNPNPGPPDTGDKGFGL